MRQTEVGKTDLAGCSSGQPATFPDVFLVRGSTGDGEDCLAAFDRQSIILSRAVGGIACKIRLRVQHYEAVALVSEPGCHTIRLFHRDPCLTLEVAAFARLSEAEAHRDQLSEVLDLPALTLARGVEEEGEARASTKRRVDRALRARRARFLTRRESGTVSPIRRLEGHEIIARG